jgi:hypothetical protein
MAAACTAAAVRQVTALVEVSSRVIHVLAGPLSTMVVKSLSERVCWGVGCRIAAARWGGVGSATNAAVTHEREVQLVGAYLEG